MTRRAQNCWPGRWLMGACAFLALAGCDLPGKPQTEDMFVPPDQEVRFDYLYRTNCAGCHGAEGYFGPAPPLNNTLFLNIVPDEVLAMVIAGGRPQMLMPAFAHDRGGHLTDQQVAVLAGGIKARWLLTRATPQDLPAYSIPESGRGNAQKGLAVFARACASCHGAEGYGGSYGDKPTGRPVGAIHNPAFLALISEQALRRYVITGRPDLEMPSYQDNMGRPEGFKPLSPAEIDDLVALLATWKKEGATPGL